MSNKPEILSERYVKGWCIVCRAGFIVVIAVGLVYFVLQVRHIIPMQTTKILLLFIIALLFETRRASLLENQAIYKAITDSAKND